MFTLHTRSICRGRSFLLVSTLFLTAAACSSDPNGDADSSQGGQGGEAGLEKQICPTRTQSIGVGQIPSDVYLLDLDADGDLDVTVSRFGSDYGETYETTPVALINDGRGAFEERLDLGELTDAPATVNFMGDLDHKGGVDAIIHRGDPHEILVLTSNAKGDFRLFERLDSEISRVDAVDDFDGDGSMDILASRSGSDQSVILRNLGDGHFGELKELNFPGSDVQAVEDIDQDGDVDLLVARQFKLNDGQASFDSDGPKLPKSTNPSRTHYRFGDLDGNATLDAVTFISYEQDVNIYFQQDGNFSSSESLDLHTSCDECDVTDIIVADMNEDGFKDIIVAVDDGSAGGVNEIWLNQGTGSFEQSGPRFFLGDSSTAVIAIGDLNGDGLTDLYEGNGNENGDQQHSIYLFEEKALPQDAECAAIP